jgi:hypothetical protein
MSLTDKLRDEIIESQKAQAVFTRWKLLLVAGFGAAGLGVLPDSELSIRSMALLSLLPFVCWYVDTLCYHSGLRVMTIAKYFRIADQRAPVGTEDYNVADLLAVRDYELFCRKHRHSFGLEGVALLAVSVVVAAVVAFMGIGISWALPFTPDPYPPSATIETRLQLAVVLFVSGLIGGIASVSSYVAHRRKVEQLDKSTSSDDDSERIQS